MRLPLITAFIFLGATAPGLAASRTSGTLRAGTFFWEPELSQNGPLVIIVSLPQQTLSAYRNGIRIGYSSISSGTKGRRIPTGVFTILEKEVTHFSNKYNHARMPYMQRLTWEGVAMHGGDLPGYPASHGCIRLPHQDEGCSRRDDIVDLFRKLRRNPAAPLTNAPVLRDPPAHTVFLMEGERNNSESPQ